MNDLPEPLTPDDCDMGGAPFPHELLVYLCANAFGNTEEETIKMARSFGMTRVIGGWVNGTAGNG